MNELGTIYDKLKRAYRRGTGVRLSADEVTMLLEDTAIQDAAYSDYEEFVRDRDGVNAAEHAPERKREP